MHRLKNLNPYEQHKVLINEHKILYGASKQLERNTCNDKSDFDVIKENHKFLWTDEDDADTWEKRVAKKYYDKLFKEYTVCDLSRYKENKIALRWRIEKEVICGKGQFSCGNKICRETIGLRSWELNFAYIQDGEKQNALVKQRLCPECSRKLNYHSRKREVKRISKQNSKSSDRKDESPDAVDRSSTNNLECKNLSSENSEVDQILDNLLV